MDNRLELQSRLESIIGNKNVYFQPPASIKLSYPCVIYNIGSGDVKYADDKAYRYTYSYEITFIYKRPTLGIIEQMLSEFQMCKLSRVFTNDNLNHYVFSLYF